MSLHGCSLTNADIELVAEGLAVNSSLQRLTLSLNLIDDVGFLALFRALSGNKKSQLVGLDCSYNLLQGGQAAKVAFLQYEAPHPHTQLVVNLMFNRILEYYHPAIHLSTIGDVTPLALLYTSEDLVALHYANHKLSDRQTHEQEKGEHSNSNSNSGTAGSKGGRGRGGGRGGKGGEVRRSSKYILLKGREGFDPQTLSSKPPPRPPTGPAGGVGAGGAYLEPAYAHASASMDVQESQQQWAEMEGVLRTRSARNRSRSRGGSFDPGPSITPSNTSPPSSPSIKFRKSLTANI
ncbi:hypothetical protein B484DRAFT_179169 [Ochromonadaceae sp. CCMP2298]|nr:hypothetical protein B484DRAFT_179169 [Ochromonadaceae sp. CCMP2298]